jgi:uncharacterized membrane protein
MDELNSSQPIVFYEVEHKNERRAEMENINLELLKEREKIMKLVDQFDDLSGQYNDNSIYVRQSNASYILWTILAVTIVVIIIKMLVTPQTRGTEHIKFVFKILLGFAFLITITKLNNPTGFVIFGAFLLIILLVVVSKGSDSVRGNSGYGFGTQGY